MRLVAGPTGRPPQADRGDRAAPARSRGRVRKGWIGGVLAHAGTRHHALCSGLSADWPHPASTPPSRPGSCEPLRRAARVRVSRPRRALGPRRGHSGEGAACCRVRPRSAPFWPGPPGGRSCRSRTPPWRWRPAWSYPDLRARLVHMASDFIRSFPRNARRLGSIPSMQPGAVKTSPRPPKAAGPTPGRCGRSPASWCSARRCCRGRRWRIAASLAITCTRPGSASRS